MICPACKSDMIVVEHHKIELDYCIKCRGVWFDSGELALLLHSVGMDSSQALLQNILHAPEVVCAEHKQKCPICRKKMKKAAISEQPQVLIDVCPRGDGLWFDGGEVVCLMQQIAAAMPAKGDSSGQVISFLGDVFQAEK